ncbi:MAG: ComEA family DNA-binding protein [Chloroflexi bacterium]|uniref:ComEA family DNA-binding protein n=1 Tax=Candidatus Chlorohelix allophototropha TaxID=3003348 RepID=A0A8T7LZY9_9CHLR|nr:ComEA family DNA-binding protein [Chloroflexota bacterium]WJW65986.1 ComEA family DNA-binding protein [Chloroflexota bacterium L227-S17]
MAEQNKHTSNKTQQRPGIINATMVITFLLMAAIGIGIFFSAKTDTQIHASSKQVTPTTDSSNINSPLDSVIKVHIAGAVRNPGVYRLKEGDRVEDAINAAGGITDEADLLKIDLARRIVDEMQIIVPSWTPTAAPLTTTTTIPLQNTPSPPLENGSDGKINVNSASATELDKLPGIGTVLSARIVEYRSKIGLYRNIEDLRKIPGITNSVIEKIKDLIAF